MNTRVFPDAETLAAAAAESFKALALEAVAQRGRFVVALSGGSTPKIIYETLSRLPGLTWEDIHLCWGDERLVAPDDPRSNYQMVKTALLDHIAIPASNLHRIRGEFEPAAAVAAYTAELEALFKSGIAFDLVHLGLGPDGHTASLFPATPQLESPAIVRQTFPTPGLEPQVPRVTLGLPTLNGALVKQFFVTGTGKRDILERIRAGQDVPAAQVSNAEWWLDQAAANP